MAAIDRSRMEPLSSTDSSGLMTVWFVLRSCLRIGTLRLPDFAKRFRSSGSFNARALMGDYDNDNRADLWVFDTTNQMATVYGDTVWVEPKLEQATRFTEVIGQFLLPESDYQLFGDHDRDGAMDILLLSEDGTIEVRGGPGMGTVLFEGNVGPISTPVAADDYNVDE